MKIGVFDSGLGGLIIAKAIRDKLPEHDMAYLGDTLHVPYGSRSQNAVLRYTQNSIDFLFREKNCQLIIVACNTASAIALRNIQQGYLVENYPDRRVLGVVVPTLEVCIERGHKRIGLLATERIVHSDIYRIELQKLDTGIELYQEAAPLLVPAIEYNSRNWHEPLMKEYIAPLKANGVESLILGCTHYTYLKKQLRNELGHGIDIISQDEIIPDKLEDYLKRHPEIDGKIGRNGFTDFLVTDITDQYVTTAREIYDVSMNIEEVNL